MTDETGTFLTDQAPVTTPATGSSNLGINRTGANLDDVPLDLGRVALGVAVIDLNGDQVGRVSGGQAPVTEILPDAPAGIAEDLVDTGYLRVDGSGHMDNDVYVGGDQIDVIDQVVTLTVRREDLVRAN